MKPGVFSANGKARVNRPGLFTGPKCVLYVLALLVAALVVVVPLSTTHAQSKDRPAAHSLQIDKATRAALAKSIRSGLSKVAADQPPPSSAFKSTQNEIEWLAAMSPKLATRISNHETRIDFLKSVHYEATRAGLDPQLVIGIIEVLSNFDKTKVGHDGNHGYMQVHPRWVQLIGKKGDVLFNLRTNLRYGCTILRHYLDIERGDLFRALNRYHIQLPDQSAEDCKLDDPAFPREVESRWKNQWKYERT